MSDHDPSHPARPARPQDPGADAWRRAEHPPLSPPRREPTPSSGTFQPRVGSRFAIRRAGALAVVLAVAGVAFWYFGIREDPEPVAEPAPELLELHGWAPYWALEHSTPELRLRAEYFSEISPFWYQATGVETIEADPSSPDEATAEFLRTARREGVRIVPSIIDTLPAGEMANILANDDQRRRHVAAIVDFVEEGEFDGVDIDYEQFAFADGRDTWDTTRPSWVAFIDELSDELHSADRTLTVSIPPVYDDGRTNDSGYWVYDYAAITPMVDRIRVMAYDYSTEEPGPVAPLNWVRRAVQGTAEASGDPSKLVLGLPIYGYNWPIRVQGKCPADDPSVGRTTVNIRTLDELVERREARPVYDEDTGEYSFRYRLELSGGGDTCTQTRQVHYVEATGAQLRLEIAREADFGGVSLWAFGFENGTVWNRIIPSLAKSTD